MADIREKILSKYGIDIVQENIFKLYKIDSPDISAADLENKIQDTRKRWNSSINGANEKNKARDKARLEKADKYEKILRDSRLRKEVSAFYNRKDNSSGGSSTVTEFAKAYFDLIGTTKRVKKEDVDFFIEFYPSERKNKKAICEMLGLKSKEKEEETKEDSTAEEATKKNTSKQMIINNFDQSTVLNVSKMIQYHEELKQNDKLCNEYPTLRNGLYEFLFLDERLKPKGEIKNIEALYAFAQKEAQKAYDIKQEKGAEYTRLTDLYNKLKNLCQCKDVKDNFDAFMLLLRYPNLTSYMYAFKEMKEKTLNQFVAVAKKDYGFMDRNDFILNYYMQMSDHFGIDNHSIKSVLRKAATKTTQNKVLNAVRNKCGGARISISFGAEILYCLLYWPMFASYFVFEIAKIIFTKLRYCAIPVFLLVFWIENILLPQVGIDSILVLRKLAFKSQWLAFFEVVWGTLEKENAFGIVCASIMMVVFWLAVYILPALFAALIVTEFASDFNKRFDWIGIERTFKALFARLKERTKYQYQSHRKLFIKNTSGKILVNFACLVILFLLLHFAPIAFGKFSETTGYFQKKVNAQEFTDYLAEGGEDIVEESTVEDGKQIGDAMIITASSANIRSGPGKDYGVVQTVSQGTVFVSTGNQTVTSKGTIWYEVYLDESMTQTGWASQKVIGFQE